jgi:hypothetical protein
LSRDDVDARVDFRAVEEVARVDLDPVDLEFSRSEALASDGSLAGRASSP